MQNMPQAVHASQVVLKGKEKGAEVQVRPSCPFYGFTRMGTVIVDSHGNGCGLRGGHTPCKMEMSQLKPEWRACPLNTEVTRERLETAFDIIRIFPAELHPSDYPKWDGVSLRGWFHLIADRRPD